MGGLSVLWGGGDPLTPEWGTVGGGRRAGGMVWGMGDLWGCG